MNTLQVTTLSLVYSAAEYCVPVWLNSPYTSRIEAQLHESMHIVSGMIQSTPIYWLSVLSHKPFLEVKERLSFERVFKNIYRLLKIDQFQVLTNIACLERNMLRSRYSSISTARALVKDDFWHTQHMEIFPCNAVASPASWKSHLDLTSPMWYGQHWTEWSW